MAFQTTPNNNVLANILSLGATKMIYPRVEATFQNEFTSGFCDICASYPSDSSSTNLPSSSSSSSTSSTTIINTRNICLNSCCCHYCTLSAMTFHLMGFEDPAITQMLKESDERPDEMMAMNCMNRPICCLYACVDLFAFSSVSTLAALQIRSGVRKRYKIKESCLKSTAACLCCFFSMRQVQHELWIHGELYTAGAYFKAPARPPAHAIVSLPPPGEAERIENEIRLRTAQLFVDVLENAASRIEAMQQQRRSRNNNTNDNTANHHREPVLGTTTTTSIEQTRTGPPEGYNIASSSSTEEAQTGTGTGTSASTTMTTTMMGVVVDSTNHDNNGRRVAAVGVPVME